MPVNKKEFSEYVLKTAGDFFSRKKLIAIYKPGYPRSILQFDAKILRDALIQYIEEWWRICNSSKLDVSDCKRILYFMFSQGAYLCPEIVTYYLRRGTIPVDVERQIYEFLGKGKCWENTGIIEIIKNIPCHAVDDSNTLSLVNGLIKQRLPGDIMPPATVVLELAKIKCKDRIPEKSRKLTYWLTMVGVEVSYRFS